jgi:tetratricopeptide (TPR) repeat protein
MLRGQRQRGDYDRAIADYDEAIRLDPKDEDYQFARAQAYRSKSDCDSIAGYIEAHNNAPDAGAMKPCEADPVYPASRPPVRKKWSPDEAKGNLIYAIRHWWPLLDAPGEAEVTDMLLRHSGARDMNGRQANAVKHDEQIALQPSKSNSSKKLAEFLLANLESNITKPPGG